MINEFSHRCHRVNNGIHLLEILKESGHRTEFIINLWVKKNIKIKTNYGITVVKNLAYRVYEVDSLSTTVVSGSY